MKLNLSKFKITNKGLYWGLIFTFALLYLCVGFVSTLHSITFFQLANTVGLAILLGLTYEVGQAAVLFSILMSKRNKESYLSWALMFLLTALQVTANVYASFKFMATSGSMDWQYWQKAILFGVQAENAEMYQMIISWIAGALLPIVALGMTALVAQNMKFMDEDTEEKENLKVGSVPDEDVDDVINNEVNKRVAEILYLSKAAALKSEQEEIDESGIGGEPTPEEQQKISDYIDEEERMMIENLEEDARSLIPDIRDKVEPIIEPPKPDRPPKIKTAESKKEKELLPKEDVRVPEKPKRFVNPLKTKGKKIKPVKSLKGIVATPSTGDKIIQIIETINNHKDKEPIINDIELNLNEPEVSPAINKVPYIEGGVEVVDVKAIPLAGVKKNESVVK